MKSIISGAAVVAALSFGMTAHASCTDPRVALKQNAFEQAAPLNLNQGVVASHLEGKSAAQKIVGTWLVTYTSGGAPFAQAFIQWHGDRTEWENINLPLSGGNICLGSWRAVNFTHVHRSHVGWSYTDGVLSGYFTETETDEVAWDGNSYTGTNDTKIYDLSGHLLFEVPGTASGKRIAL